MTYTDPTAIPIEFDPAQQKMRGVAIHGNTPFEVAYISHITGNLWTGGCTSGLILPSTIQHVVSLYPWEAYRSRHELRTNTAVRLYDDMTGVDTDMVLGLARWVNVCVADAPTLVHCQAGLNRSGMVAAASLMLAGASAREAIELLREKRCSAVLCNTSFESWLNALVVTT